jgi:HAE1 family hydrophobic/amphiphilic exporter-1
MQLTRVAITRPVFILMVIGALLIVGAVSWTRMGVDLMPTLDFPIVVVTTAYPGAGADSVNTEVTRPIEDAAASVNDVDYIQSQSVEGLSIVEIVFTDKAAKDVSNDVQRKVSAIRGTLPTDAKEPSIGKYDPNAQPVLELTLSSGKQDLGSLQRLAEDKVQKRLQATTGVGQVNLLGGLIREIDVRVDQQKLEARGLSILQVNQALGADNLNMPAGSVTDFGKNWNVRLDNRAQTPDQLNTVLIADTPGGPVYLRDVATVVDTYKKVTTINRVNGQSALGITIVKQADANTVQTTDAVKQTLAQLQPELPPDVSVTIATDASVYIRNSVADVERELAVAVVLTGLVLMLFLHTFRSTAIVLLAIPTSLIATLAVMDALGFTFNTMSLMGLYMTVGILVDDSIVVLENIFRHLKVGEAPKEAALRGRSEIGFAAIAITLVDVVVFAPIGFMSSYVGQYMRQFGLVVVAATLFSLFISFTLTPMLASRWYQRQAVDADSAPVGRNPLMRFGRAWDAGYDRLSHGYARMLRFAVGVYSRWLIIAVGLASLAAGVLLVTTGTLSTEFMPEADDGQMQVGVEMPPGTPLEVTNTATQTVEERIASLPEVKTVFTSVGVRGGSSVETNPTRYASLYVTLVDRRQRNRTPMELSEVVRTFGADIPGARVTASSVGMFGPGGAPLEVRVQGEDQAVLTRLAQQVAAMMRAVPGTRDVDDGGVTGEPQLTVSIDRQRAADLGLSPGQVASVLRTGLGGSTVSTFRPTGTSGWDISVILNPDERARLDQVNQIPIVTPRGATVRLGQIAQISQSTGPTQISGYNRQRTVYVSGFVSGRPQGDVTADIQEGIDRMALPSGYTVAQGGMATAQSDSFLQVFKAMALSVLFMYMLMAALFESPLYPLMVMMSLPLAAVGAFGLLALTNNTLNMLSLIGMILLLGLVGKNAILLVDYTNTLRKRGYARNDALLEAGPTRLRPILMTTAAMVLAMSPVALRLGEGGDFYAPMAVAVIGGLLTSTLLTLVMIPAVYTIFDDVSRLLGGVPRLLCGGFRPTGHRPPPARRSSARTAPAAHQAS